MSSKTNQRHVRDESNKAHLVVARDGDVDVSSRRVGVAQSDDGDVDVGRLRHRLVVHAWVRHDQHARLTVSSLQTHHIDVHSQISCK